MLSAHFKKIILILIVSAFTSSGFAAWTKSTHTTCAGNTCHHTSTTTKCNSNTNNCHTVRHGSTWHR
jgi:hypothetical protein